MAERERTATPELAARPRFLGAGYGRMLRSDFVRNRTVYLMAAPVVAFFLVFYYAPMFGLVISFKRFTPALGVFGSPWVGLKYFQDFFESYFAVRIIRNTILISVLSLVWGFPAPIILALLVNEVRTASFKRAVQSLTYLPHFISLVVVCGLLLEFAQSGGLFNDLRGLFGADPIPFFQDPRYFRGFYVASGIWQEIGWGSIIYLAALSAIDPQLYEAATIDGANRFRQLRHITLPSIAPTIVVLLILRLGQLMTVGHEKIILLYNPSIYETADVIATFVYRKGLLDFSWSYGTAVGLFNSLINLALVVMANAISRRVNDTSLW
ncbi:MAG: ABC transporter permease subunit [Spirochaetaceae bacterium]|nr:ABC transporter permease subunit [Spirochaetaceae bacterium]